MGKVVGYESVRVAPDRQLVQHATALYAQINAGKTPQGRGSAIAYHSQWFALPALTLIGAAIATASGALAWAAGLAALSALSAMAATQFRSNSELAALQACMQHPLTDPLAVLTYARHGGALGALEVALTASNSHLDTMLTRIEDSATTVAQRSVSAYELSSQAVHRLEQQQQQTELVATAMHQMTTTIAEVASHVQETATKANDADGLARQGSAIAKQTREAILQPGGNHTRRADQPDQSGGPNHRTNC
jgi:aerotaxis receptor